MPLPVIKHPQHKIKVPSLNKEYMFRPFTVKEEKILLSLKGVEDEYAIASGVIQIAQNCCLGTLDISKLPAFDVEYIFLKLRGYSVNNILELELTSEKEKIQFEVDLDTIEVTFRKEHSKNVKINEELFLHLRYPSLYEHLEFEKLEDDIKILEFFFKCIDKVVDGDDVYTDFTGEEFKAFIEQLPSDAIDKISEFFATMPVLEYVKILKKKDGTEIGVTLRGLTSFFPF